MADYGVNIAVAVKNSQAVTQLSNKLKDTAAKIEHINTHFNSFANMTGKVLPGSIANFNKALSDASSNLNNAALGTKAATEAARDYVKAQNEANAALKEQQNLLRAARLAGETVSKKPFGPMPFGQNPGDVPTKGRPAFDPVEGRQQAIARMVMLETAADVKVADAKRNFILELGQIELDLDRKIRNREIDNIIEQVKLESKLQDDLFKSAIKKSEKRAQAFMEELGFRKGEELKAIAEVDRARKKAEGEAVRLTGQTSPIGGALGIPGSPAALLAAQKAQKLKSAQSSALIGGAFPLLFGQGLASSIGGGLGGFAGGLIGGEFGFGLSLIGTQIGSIITQANEMAAALGKAFRTGVGAAQALEEAIGELSVENKDYINNLEKSGQLGKQQRAILEQLEEKLGNGAKAFLESAKAADRADRSTQQFIKTLQRLIVPAGTEFDVLTTGKPVTEVEKTPELTKAAQRRIEVSNQSLEIEKLISSEQALQGTKLFKKIALAKQATAQAKFDLELTKLRAKEEQGIITEKEYENELEIKAIQLGRIMTDIEREKAEAIKNSAEEAKKLVDQLALGVARAQQPGVSLAKQIRNENKFLQNAVKFGEKSARDLQQITRLTMSGAMSREEATKLVAENRKLKDALDAGKTSEGKDFTPQLKKRLGIIEAQIKAEEEIVGLSQEGAAIISRKLAFEKRIAQIRETGKAERQKLADLEDISLSKSIEENGIKLATLQFEREIAVALEQSTKASEKTLEPVQKKLNALKDRNAFEREYGELIMSGSTTAAAKQVIEAKKQVKEIDELVKKQILSNQIQINILRVIVAQAINTDHHAEAQEALNDALEREKEIREEGEKAKGEVKGKKTPAENIEAEMKRIQGALNDLVDPSNQVIAAANAIGDAFSESFKGLITGSMSAQEALRNLFARTADHFADMAAQMIAHTIRMKILGIALNFFGSAAGSAAQGSFAGVPNSTLDSVLPSTSSLADAAASTPITPLRLNAEGSYVSGPTATLVGEGGQGEYIIPESKMRESMARYSRGARGSSVIPETGASGTSGEGGGVAVAAPIDVRYTVERINSVDYVTADQFQQGIRQAADQGAKQGEQQTLKRLQMSSSTRKRLGM